MRPTPRDGVINTNGLSAEFRFIRPHPSGGAVSFVETAAGDGWGPFVKFFGTIIPAGGCIAIGLRFILKK